MVVKSIGEYVRLGRHFSMIRFVLPTEKKPDISDHITYFLRGLQNMPLPNTQRASEHLAAFRKDVLAGDESELGVEARDQLLEITQFIDPVFSTETQGQVAHVLTDKRHDISKLLDDVATLMAEGAYEAMPDISQYDLQQAGRCIAFELPTAAAFHALRAVEGMLRKVYEHLVKKSRLQEKKRTWGAMTDQIKRRKKKPKGLPELLGSLDFIRHHYRNPTDHPEMRYDIDQAQDLFGMCVAALNIMIAMSCPETASAKSMNTLEAALSWLTQHGF